MEEFINEARHSLSNIADLSAMQEHYAVAMALKAMATAFMLEAERQQEKHLKLQAYLDL